MFNTNFLGYNEPMNCNVDGCEGVVRSRGYCARHYENFRRTGEPLSLREQKALLPKPLCAIGGCGRPVRLKGMCNRHYENVRIYGQAVPEKDLPLDERIARIGWTVTPRGCWEWNGKRNDSGYGILHALRHGHDGARAHRVMFELHVGPIPPGAEIRHKCDNPPCVNPGHLVPGTHLMNMGDMSDRGRSGQAYENRDYQCRNGHDMTSPGAFKIVHPRAGRPYRSCIECARRRSREYAARRRAR